MDDAIQAAEPVHAAMLKWDIADRLRKALRVADVSTNEMADYLGVARQTVSGWTNGRAIPQMGMLRLWAARTGVPLEWLLYDEFGELTLLKNRLRARPTNARPKGFEPLTSWLVAA